MCQGAVLCDFRIRRITMMLFLLFLVGINTEGIYGKLGQEGCEAGWAHHKQYCYLATGAHTHFDSAKAICTIKGASLASLWTDEERMFVVNLLQNLDTIKPSTWLGVGVVQNEWVWLDGSGSVQSLFKELPDPDDGYCGFLSPDGILQFINCDIAMSAFICKKPLDIVYIPDTANITSTGVYFNEASSETLFERLWPPQLDTISLNMTSAMHMATIEVASETDCAYRCYTLDECKTFSVACKSSSKCKLLFCKLFSGLDLQ